MDLLRLGGGGLGLRTCLRRWVGVTRTEKEAEGITRTVKEVGGFAAVGGEAPPNRDFGVGIYGAVLREIGFINIHNKSNNHHPIELAKERRIREGTKEQERERERNQRAFGAARGDGVAWLRWVLWGRGGQKRKKGKMEVRGADEEWKKGKGTQTTLFHPLPFSPTSNLPSPHPPSHRNPVLFERVRFDIVLDWTGPVRAVQRPFVRLGRGQRAFRVGEDDGEGGGESGGVCEGREIEGEEEEGVGFGYGVAEW
ncbi:unnamed protein product [Prunus armeniaca]|uniref:Uncharacterized protein n=1 Tax=Prunus armeniaca TaxID=36596 RepID=A0A6J5UWA7_PRUAR|nr:unnamed protein product [Prunus armeniaca]